jgi:selenocysteine insertion sequence-binding protein 2
VSLSHLIEDSTSNGGVDDRIREILGSAYERDVPVVFALSRTRLGLALGKSLKMSVIGFLETKGMQEQFDHMVSSAYQQRVSWMERELPQKQTQGS